jgi:hypothetical protein
MANTQTARRKELIAALVIAQNYEGNENVDILTITGFMDEAEIEKHLAWYENKERQRYEAELRQSYRRLTGAAK